MKLQPHSILLLLIFATLPVQAQTGGSHWAFEPPVLHDPPAVVEQGWDGDIVDRFVRAKLRDHNLKPSPRADKRTLIRRAYLDLIGLPPTMQQVRDFEADSSPDAFAKVVEQLLQSPHYGERWGRYWLDLARYADTKGYVYGDREERFFVHAHLYRDWVVQALNDDLPYDQFLRLQIAADRISEGQPNSLAAMGFLTIGRRFLGVVPDIVDDRIDVLTRTTQGLTVACARCHDHKYDPIPTADYYSLYGIFTASTERIVRLGESEADAAAREAFETELRARQAKLDEAFAAKKAEMLHRLRSEVARYMAAIPNAEKLPPDLFYELRLPGDVIPTAVRYWQTYLAERDKSFDPIFEPWHVLVECKDDEFSARAGELLRELLESEGGRLNPIVRRHVTSLRPQSLADVAEMYGRILTDVDRAWRAMSGILPGLEGLPDAAMEDLRQVLYAEGSPTRLPEGGIHEIEWFFDESTRVEIGKLQTQIERWIVQSDAAPPYAQVFADREPQPNPRILLRGNQATPGAEVPRRYLHLIEGKQQGGYANGSGRLQLADAIASPDNPLTARVWVNRVWQQHFGQGLVRTPSDFGTRAEQPVHRELLDTLAVMFMQSGWSTKQMHRWIMLSNTYQQASADRPDAFAADPDNELLWRMNPRRLDFEAMRDSTLAVTGELDLSMGGKPVNLFADGGTRNTIWGAVDGAGERVMQRRTIYGLIDRQFLPGVYRVFDFANPDIHISERPTTTSPQQALFLANNAFAMERARAMIARADIAEISDPQLRVRKLYELILQRQPSVREIELALAFVRQSSAAEDQSPVALTIDQTPWRYGLGKYDEAADRVATFEDLPYFTGAAWQGGASWPDTKYGWAQFTAEGGHTGNDIEHAGIRRFIAPRDMTVRVHGLIDHPFEAGDGIRTRIVSSRHGQLGTWNLHNTKTEYDLASVVLKAGDTLDFVADILGTLNSDQYLWRITVEVVSGEPERWNAAEQFAGPSPPPTLRPWEQYAQVLLMSNEFLFVD